MDEQIKDILDVDIVVTLIDIYLLFQQNSNESYRKNLFRKPSYRRLYKGFSFKMRQNNASARVRVSYFLFFKDLGT